MAKMSVNELVDRCSEELHRLWIEPLSTSSVNSSLPIEIQEAIERSINSATKTYRYVLPTQTLAKLVDPSLNSRFLQEGSGLPGSFDARSLCHKVVVPFDRENHNVLGGAPEPYVNNPLRIGSLHKDHRGAQKNKSGFDDLCSVVDYLESNSDGAGEVLKFILLAIRRRLELVDIVYPVPNRVSLVQTITILNSFLESRTGGLRLQAVSVALFRTIGRQFSVFERVNASRINAADASTGSSADLSCVDADGQVVLAVEVKDQELKLRHVQDKLPAVREQGVRELLFLSTSEPSSAAIEELSDVQQREFVTGQNIYLVSFHRFSESCLVLFGESGRREFLIQIGIALDETKADLIHRQAWRDLLGTL